MTKISIDMNAGDFSRLYTSAHRWTDVADPPDRFQPLAVRVRPATATWQAVYGFGTSYLPVLLAAAWLDTTSHHYEVLWDDIASEYAIATTYNVFNETTRPTADPGQATTPPRIHVDTST